MNLPPELHFFNLNLNPQNLWYSVWKNVNKNSGEMENMVVVKRVLNSSSLVLPVVVDKLIFLIHEQKGTKPIANLATKFGLLAQEEAQEGVPLSLFQGALFLFLHISLTRKGWTKVGDVYVFGDPLAAQTTQTLETIQLSPQIYSDSKISFSIQCSVSKMTPLTVEDLLKPEAVEDFDKGVTVSCVKLKERSCYVLPSFKQASIVSASKNPNLENEQLSSEKDLCDYWSLVHHLVIPKPIRCYLEISFSSFSDGFSLTYPLNCCWKTSFVNQLQKTRQDWSCLLYTSPSPRD
eukprot:TRINITY_DN3229_c0_g2_i6.p1 TRINITY_DN3229_c0_g2~~TRINITY_DN3229_c0_g2_i6.p1  ORF type:complete len:302 (-),score=66.64 TRINITY_DN3229_c0_g2_i6:39-914(-)